MQTSKPRHSDVMPMTPHVVPLNLLIQIYYYLVLIRILVYILLLSYVKIVRVNRFVNFHLTVHVGVFLVMIIKYNDDENKKQRKSLSHDRNETKIPECIHVYTICKMLLRKFTYIHVLIIRLAGSQWWTNQFRLP